MKIRNGFVSNSSSSSFAIPMNALSNWQIEMLIDHIDVAQKYNKINIPANRKKEDYYAMEYCDPSDAWNIKVQEDCVCGDTSMDNFDMEYFIRNLVKVPDEYVLYGEEWDNHSEGIKRLNQEIIVKQRKEKLEKIEKEKD